MLRRDLVLVLPAERSMMNNGGDKAPAAKQLSNT